MIEAARGTLRAALNHAMSEELISRNVAELVKLPKTRKKLKRRNSWTVVEASPAAASEAAPRLRCWHGRGGRN